MRNPKIWSCAKRLVFFPLVLMLLVGARPVRTLFAQTLDARTLFFDAEHYFLYHDFKEALSLYLKLHEADSLNANINYRIGVCYLNIPEQKAKAIPYLKKAVKSLSAKYQEGSFKERLAPREALFHLGNAFRIANRIDQALKSFAQYKELLSTKEVASYDYVLQQIDACIRAREMMAEPLDIKFESLKLFGSATKSMHSPSLSANGQHMVFTVHEKFYDAIYWVTKRNEAWGEPVNITLDLAAEGEIYATSLNADGTQLFLFKNEYGVGNIYSSERMHGKWQKIVKVPGDINSRYWETHASIAPNGQTLYFTSNRRGGEGGLDIYYSQLLPNGQWGSAVNLGPTINTPFNEEAPYLMNDNTTLVFASQGHKSMGGYDIFYSKQYGGNSWTEPSNLGYPISTTDDDIYYFPMADGKGLVSSPSPTSPHTSQIGIITSVIPTPRALIPIHGTLVLSDNKEVSGPLYSICIIDAKTGTVVNSIKPAGTQGSFSFAVEPGVYRIIASGQGYLHDTLLVSIPASYQPKEYPVSLNLTPESVTKGEFITIRSIQFGFDSYQLNRDAMFEAERIVAFLVKYPDVTIVITGHTDSKGSALYNKKLSFKRANSVIDYMAKQGIARARMEAKAAGSFENVASNFNPDGTDNPEGRLYNRRATVSIAQSTSNIQIKDELSIPEHAKVRAQQYCVLLVPLGQTPGEAALRKLKMHQGFEQKILMGKGKQKAHVVGTFNHKAEAIRLLDYCMENGFPLASLAGADDISQSLSLGTPRPAESYRATSEQLYTIQVASSAVPIEVNVKGSRAEEIKTRHGTYNYIHGRYRTWEEADENVALIKLQYPNALVVNIKRFEE